MKRVSILLAVVLLASVLNVHAQAPVSVAVIGDSLSHEYRCVPRGNATSYNWVEILARLRGVDFGALSGNCYAYDFAWSGNTITNNMNSMVTNALNSPTGKVIIWLGYNDIAAGANVSTLISTYTTQLNRLLTKYAPGSILAVAIPQDDCGSNNANITNFNNQLAALASSKGIAFAAQSSFCASLNSYAVNSNEYKYGGQTVNRWSWCFINCLRLPNDGHHGNIAQAIMANSLMASFLGVAPVTEAEVLAMMGIGSTPPTRTPTPAPTRTPTPFYTPTVTLTPTPQTFTVSCYPKTLVIVEVPDSSTIRYQCQ